MKFLPAPFNLVLKSAAMCTLALSLLPASAQDAAKPDTHGINVANMDKSIKPGDNFYLYCNGDWIKNAPNCRPTVRGLAFSPRWTTLPTSTPPPSSRRLPRANAPAGSSQRKIADLYNSYMDEAAIDAKGWRRCNRISRPLPAIHNKKELAYALGQTLRADVDALNNTNFHTANLFGCGWRPASTIPITTPLTCCRAACNFPIASTTCPTTST